MLEKISGGIAVEGMEALIPALCPGELELLTEVVPAGTQPEVPRLNPAPRPPDLVDKRRFGAVELTIEYRGDEITIVVPGVVRLTGTRADALSMIEALARTPRPA